MNDPCSSSPAELDTALRAIEHDFPGWMTWHGIAGLVYARRVRSSPPIVVRAATIPALRTKISDAERKITR